MRYMVFTKLHATILDSSVWQEPAHVRLVWITMLAMADQDGVVHASVGGLAHRARVTRDECADALTRFLGPDPDSRDRTTGERIEQVPGGWLVLNHANYRDRQTREQALTAARVARHRERKAAEDAERYVTPGNATSPDISKHLAGSASESASVLDPLSAGAPRSGDALDAVMALEASGYGGSTTTPAPPRSRNSGVSRPIPVACPSDVASDIWADWVAFRKSKRAPVTERVLASTRKQAAAAGMTMDEALTHWVTQGYVGFFPPNKGGGGNGKKTGGQLWREANDGSSWNNETIDIPNVLDGYVPLPLPPGYTE